MYRKLCYELRHTRGGNEASSKVNMAKSIVQAQIYGSHEISTLKE